MWYFRTWEADAEHPNVLWNILSIDIFPQGTLPSPNLHSVIFIPYCVLNLTAEPFKNFTIDFLFWCAGIKEKEDK